MPNINEGDFTSGMCLQKNLVWCKVFSFKYKLVGSIQETYYLPFGKFLLSWKLCFYSLPKKPEQWKAMINCLKSGEFHANSHFLCALRRSKKSKKLLFGLLVPKCISELFEFYDGSVAWKFDADSCFQKIPTILEVLNHFNFTWMQRDTFTVLLCFRHGKWYSFSLPPSAIKDIPSAVWRGPGHPINPYGHAKNLGPNWGVLSYNFFTPLLYSLKKMW